MEGYGLVNVCEKLEDLRVIKYVKVFCEGDLSQLIVSGSPSPEQLEAAKVSIISQYHEACPSPLSTQHLRIAKTIQYFSKRIMRISLLVNALRGGNSEVIAQILRDEKFNYKFTPETMEADLDKVEEGLKGDLHKMRKAEAEYQALDKKKDNKPPTRKQYVRTILQYNSVFGTKYELKDDNFYMDTFCEMVNQLQEHYKHLTKRE